MTFKTLSEEEQAKRLAKYEKERESRQTNEMFGRLVREPHFKPTRNGDEQAIFRLAVYDHKKDETTYHTFSAFVRRDKTELRKFYSSLKRGDGVAIEYKVNNGYNNVWKVMLRKKASKKENDNVTLDTFNRDTWNIHMATNMLPNGNEQISYQMTRDGGDFAYNQTIDATHPLETVLKLIDADTGENIDLNGLRVDHVMDYIEMERIEQIVFAKQPNGHIQKATIILRDEDEVMENLPF